MPAEYRIDPNERMIWTRAWGTIEDRDLTGHRAQLAADARFDRAYAQLLDFSEVTEIRITTGAIRALAGPDPFLPTAWRAVVVPNDVAYGMARMFALMGGMDESRFKVFRDRAEALQWLHANRP